MKKFLLLLIMLTAFSANAEVVDKILATVNGEPVTLSELDKLLFPVYKQYGQLYKGEDLEKYKKEAQKKLLQQLIENKLILQQAKKEGIKVAEAEMEEEFADIKDKFGSLEEFKKVLEKEGLTLEQYKKDLTEQLTTRAMIERYILPKTKISPKEIEEYYDSHKDEFIQPEMVKFGHILIKDDENKAKEIYGQLEGGADFTELATQYSEAGEPGSIPIDKLKPELREIVESLKPGEYSKLIKTEIGWHIIKLEEKTLPERIPISESWGEIEDMLFKKKLNLEHKKWISRIKAKAHIVIEE